MKAFPRRIAQTLRLLYWGVVLRIPQPHRFLRSYETIRASRLFDAAWYRRQGKQAAPQRMDPLVHYLVFGAPEGRSPHPLFDGSYYLETYPDVAAAGFNPLAHFVEAGAREGRNPHPLFDLPYYVRLYPEAAEKRNPLAHYLAEGGRRGWSPHPLFDGAYYLEAYPDVAEAGLNPLAHYVAEGGRQGRNPHPLFDGAYYLRKNPDVEKAGVNPLVHYLSDGYRDGRDPHPLFHTSYYLDRCRDAEEAQANPLVHYLRRGGREGRKPHALFDGTYYLQNNPDVAAAGLNPLVHYLAQGSREGRNPNAAFDGTYYRSVYPDVDASGMDPLVHYLVTGGGQGRNPHPRVDLAYYLRTNPDVRESGVDPLVHYLEYGMREGRYAFNVYASWIDERRLGDEDRKRIRREIDAFPWKPLISVVLPVYDTEERWLRKCVDSVRRQLYPHWELCIADDASPSPRVREILEAYRRSDGRIRVAYREKNGHISACSNTALAMAAGEFVALLDHDDELAEEALYENARLLNADPGTDMIYSDEDKIGEDGERHAPFFKPDWSPDTFLSHMYTCHLGVYRTALLREIGGFRVGFEGSQDYDLVLRLTEKTRRIRHIPKVLYHWRTIRGSTALTHDSKNYAYRSGLHAIQEALDRRGEGGRAENVPNYPGQYLVRYPLENPPLVSILIPTRDNPARLEACLASVVTRTTYPRYEILILDNGSVQPETQAALARWQRSHPDRIRVLRLETPFNYSRLNNAGAREARGDLLLLLNDDVTVITPGWLGEMAGQASRRSIGAVGAVLLYPDDTIQHAGVLLGIVGPANHSHRHARADSPGYFGRLLIVANYAAVTGACLLVKRDLYLSAGGLDETLAVAYNDLDFCLRLLRMGYFHVVLPQARLYHHESSSRGADQTGANQRRLQEEAEIVQERWGDLLRNDPFYNPNLTRRREDFTIAVGEGK